jgi:transposase
MKKRRRFQAVEKVNIIRQHLLEKRPISDLCDEYGIKPTQFYQWQKMFFENGATAFEAQKTSEQRLRQQKMSLLETKLAHKDQVIAEIMEEHIKLKKKNGLL